MSDLYSSHFFVIVAVLHTQKHSNYSFKGSRNKKLCDSLRKHCSFYPLLWKHLWYREILNWFGRGSLELRRNSIHNEKELIILFFLVKNIPLTSVLLIESGTKILLTLMVRLAVSLQGNTRCSLTEQLGLLSAEFYKIFLSEKFFRKMDLSSVLLSFFIVLMGFPSLPFV